MEIADYSDCIDLVQTGFAVAIGMSRPIGTTSKQRLTAPPRAAELPSRHMPRLLARRVSPRN
jgi:hypothetical protein